MIKKILLTIILSVIVSSFLLSFEAFAQTTNLLLAVTPYKTRADLDILFSQNTQVLEYLEGEDVEEPLFISLINESQKLMLLNKGFNPKIYDTNTDIARYTLLYHPKENQFQNLSTLGEVFVLSNHYALLKSFSGKQFEHEGVAAQFFDIPFSKIISPPPLRTKTVLTPTAALSITSIPTPTIAKESTSSPKSGILILLTIIIMVIGVSAFFILKKTRSTNNPPKI